MGIFQSKSKSKMAAATATFVGSTRISKLQSDVAQLSEMSVKSPVTLKGALMIMQLQTECVEEAFKRATEAAASVTEEVAEKSWGQRYGMLKDPYGFVLSLATPAKPSEAPAAAAAATEVVATVSSIYDCHKALPNNNKVIIADAILPVDADT